MLELKEVTKKFGDRTILDHVDLTVEDGKILCIVGQSGGGKTTLLRCISGLEQIDSGQILVDGIAFDPYVNSTNDAVIGVVFQEYNLFPHLTVLKNVMEGPVHVLKEDKQTAKKRALELLDKVGLKQKATAYPNQLSGGQAQRVAIARSLAMRPRYILLDEPTSALDPELELEVLKVLLELASEKQSLIIVTHNLEFARHVADKVLFIEDGQINFSGSKDDFFNSKDPRIKEFISAMTLDNLN